MDTGLAGIIPKFRVKAVQLLGQVGKQKLGVETFVLRKYHFAHAQLVEYSTNIALI